MGQQWGLHWGPRWAQIARIAAIGAVCLSTTGCLVVAGIPLSQISTAIGVASFAMTGKGLGEHGLDVVTGKDCRLLDSLMRDERELCEERNSPATQEDFRGVIVWLEEQVEDAPRPAKVMVAATERQVAGGPIGKVARFVGLEAQIGARPAEPPAMLAERSEQPAAEPARPPVELVAAGAGRENVSIGARLGLSRTELAQVIDGIDDLSAETNYMDVVAPLQVAQAGSIDLSLRLGGVTMAAPVSSAAIARPVLATGLPRTQ
jgi:hypothetical protein